MRKARIKVDSVVGEATYHVMTRTVNGEHLLDDIAKEVLRKQLWKVADYCGVQVLTFALMSNHFHVLVRVPQKVEVTDRELLRRYEALYPNPTKYQALRMEKVRDQLKTGGAAGEAWRARQLALMGDVSQFMKLLKQRFSIWFNRTHDRFGTLWAERFKSVLVEGKRGALATMAAYIDLNPVRAGLVDDPKDYRFCGYAEAVAGHKAAAAGLALVTGGRRSETLALYRQMLFGKGAHSRKGKTTLDLNTLQEVVRSGGKLSREAVLQCRIRHFTDGAVLGSQAFVQAHLAKYRQLTGRRQRTRPRDLPAVTDWGGLMTLRGLRLAYAR
jgi:REP element-mobilizing transposase RayT